MSVHCNEQTDLSVCAGSEPGQLLEGAAMSTATAICAATPSFIAAPIAMDGGCTAM